MESHDSSRHSPILGAQLRHGKPDFSVTALTCTLYNPSTPSANLSYSCKYSALLEIISPVSQVKHPKTKGELLVILPIS